MGRNAGGAGSLLGVAAGAQGDPQTLRSLSHFAPETISDTNFAAAVRRGLDDLAPVRRGPRPPRTPACVRLDGVSSRPNPLSLCGPDVIIRQDRVILEN